MTACAGGKGRDVDTSSIKVASPISPSVPYSKKSVPWYMYVCMCVCVCVCVYHLKPQLS
jgi:hypothetical protein